jgi:phospholipid/cholesterol/gamma-HCH transport system permease protein
MAQLLGAMSCLDGRELRRTLVSAGFDSLPLAFGSGAVIGATVILQAGVYANTFGARLYVGWAAAYALLWEFGPLLLGLIMAARIGARLAAEFALLSSSGDLDGLRGVAIDPFARLIAPRVFGSILAMTLLGLVTFTTALLFETVSAWVTLGLPTRVFLGAVEDMLLWTDVTAGLIKTCAFAVAIACVSATAGLRASFGARGVGQAAAAAVVYGCAAIFALDLALTTLLERVFG